MEATGSIQAFLKVERQLPSLGWQSPPNVIKDSEPAEPIRRDAREPDGVSSEFSQTRQWDAFSAPVSFHRNAQVPIGRSGEVTRAHDEYETLPLCVIHLSDDPDLRMERSPCRKSHRAQEA